TQGAAYQGDDDGDETQVQWRVPNPHFAARPDEDRVEGWEWQANATITVTIDGQAETATADEWGNFWLDLSGSFDLQPGHLVTVTDGAYAKSHTVTGLAVTAVDPATDVVFGTAAEGSRVWVQICHDWGCVQREEFADTSGNWSADFGQPGDRDDEQETYDIQLGTSGDASQEDSDDDRTQIWWRVPNPHFSARISENQVHGYEWSQGTTVALTIDDPGTTQSPDYAAAQTPAPADWDPEQTWIGFDLAEQEFTLQPGHVLTMTDGTTVKTHVAVDLVVSDIDPDADTVSGTVPANSTVQVSGCNDWSCTNRHVTADGVGNWTVDFSVPGEEDGEQELLDILPGTSGDASVTDEDSDYTIINWYLSNPRLSVRPEDENVDGWEWTPGATVTLTVDDDGDPGNGTLWTELSTSDEWGNVSFSLYDSFDVQPGHWVRLDDGVTVKSHTVATLTVDVIDPDTDTVYGTAEPGAEVEVQIWDWDGPWRRVTADGNGNWTADFSTPSAEDDRRYDIGPGTQGAAYQRDDDGDETQVQWRVPNPNFSARPDQDRMEGWEWQANATITVTIDEQAETTTADAWGNFGLDLSDSFDLQAGQLVTVSDGSATKSHTVTELRVTGIDPATDVVSGTAAGESQVWVQICHDWGCVQREEFADASGNWAADFGQPGDRDDEQETYDIQLGTSGDAAQHDEDGDQTQISWRVLNPRFTVRLTDDQVQGDDWPLDAIVTLTIEDPSTPESPDYVASNTVGPSDGDPQQTWIGFDLRPDDFELGAGQLVTMTDGETIKSHVVVQLTIDDVDVEADVVSGTAEAGLEIRVEACNDWGCATRYVMADGARSWSADFSALGGGEDEQDTLDIAMNTSVDAQWVDGDHDASHFSWQLSNPHFRVWLDSNEIHGYQWPLETPVTVTIDNPSNGPGVDHTDTQMPTSDYCCGTWVGFYLPDSLPIGPGWTVMATNGEITRTHTVIDGLSFGGADVETDIVTGTAAPGTTVAVGICWGCYCESRDVTADRSGFWLADFSVPGEWGRTYDIVPGTGGNIDQTDEDGDGTGISWSIPNPRIEAIPDEGRIEGREWEEGAAVTLLVDGYSETQTAQIAHWDPNETYVQFNLWGIVDLQPGTVITLTDGATTKVHTVTGLAVDSADADIDTIFGRADPNSEVRIWVHNTGGEFTATADENGDWSFDFTGIFDLVPATEGQAQQADGDGDVTRANWRVPRPYLEAWAENDRIEGADWPDGTAVTLSIDDPNNGAGVDFTDTQTAYVPPWDPSRTRVDFDLWDRFDLEPGHIVTVSDGATTKTHVVTPLTIGGADPDTDVVWGTATPEGEVRIWIHNTGSDFTATADGSGNWSIDLSGLFDLAPGTEMGVQESDDDGDATRDDLRIPNPIIMAVPAEDQVNGFEWPLDAELSLTIGGLGADYTDTRFVEPCNLPWGSTSAGFEIPFDLRAGHVLTLTDGATLRAHTVTSLTIATIDADNDTVSGQAEAFSNVRILSEEPWNWVERQVTADAAGDWTADFSGATDIRPGSGGRAWQEDDAGNQTLVNWRLRNPNFSVRFTDNQVHGYDWPLDAVVTMAIDDPDTSEAPDYTVSATVGPADWNPEETWVMLPLGDFSIAPGQEVWLTDGTVTKTHTIVTLEVTDVDVESDTVSGITEQGLDVEVCIWEMDAPCRQVTADGDGNWTADFAHSHPSDDRTFDITGGTQGEVRAADDDGDATQTGWAAPGGYPSPRPPLVVPVSFRPDLDYHWTGDGDSLMVLAQLMEGLYRHRIDGSLEPAGATGYTVSADATVYTLTLRADAAWSDGVPVTAQHYVDGVERALRPELEGGYAAGLLSQLGISASAVDTYTLRFTFSQPTAHFPAIMASPALYPARLDVIDGDPEWTAAGHFVGNGPYTLIESSDYYLIEKNPLYHTAAATVDRIAFVIIPGSAEQLNAYQRGEVDVVFALGDNEARDVYNDPQLNQAMVISPRPGVFYLGLNVERDPTDQALVRQALASAIDRQTIVSDVLGLPWRETATSVIPPTIAGYQNGAVGYPFDDVQAQSYLTAAGGGPLEVVLRANIGHELAIDSVAQMWRDHLGITVTTIYEPWSSGYFPYLQGCQEDPGACDYNAYRMGWIMDYADAHNLLNDLFHPDSARQFTGWDSQDYRDQLDLAAQESEPASRVAYLQEADRILVEEETAIIPLFYYDRASLVRPSIVHEIPASG
ncbi:MAG: peptide ABC transporter substrate-binding protein, partial [Anaerolineae bacterium]